MKHLLNEDEFQKALGKLCETVKTRESNLNDVALVGIHTRGVPLADRLAKLLSEQGSPIPLGKLDINLYRDDLSEAADFPVIKETAIDFNVNDKVIYLVDDVLYTGRTIRAAMDAIFDLGRPKALHLIVMAKRNGRELPIDTDVVALDVKTKDGDNIKVKFKEIDGQDEVVLLEKGEY